MAAHDVLRDAIRAASLAMWDRRRADPDIDDDGALASTRSDMERGFLLDYAVVAVFDNGGDEHTTSACLRTDGLCASYRTVGVLTQALHDIQG